jgi:membrane protein
MSFESIRIQLGQAPILGVVVEAIVRSRHDLHKDLAASIAYFSFFSLFPMLLGVIAVASLFVVPESFGARVSAIVADAFPGSAEFVRSNVESVVRLRGAAGVTSVVALIWSGSKFFGALTRSVNYALALDRPHPALLTPLRQFGLALGVPLLLILLVGASTALDVLVQVGPGLPSLSLPDWVSPLTGQASSLALVILAAMGVYRLVSYSPPSWRSVLGGAVFAGIAFQLGRSAFLFYLDNVASLEAVYGSLTSIIVLLLWLYFSARVVLLGAEIVAVLEDRRAAP